MIDIDAMTNLVAKIFAGGMPSFPTPNAAASRIRPSSTTSTTQCPRYASVPAASS